MFERLIIVYIILWGIYNFFMLTQIHHGFNKSKTHISFPKPFSSLCPSLSERLLQWSHFHIPGWNGRDKDSLSVWETYGFLYLEFFFPFTHPSFLLPKSYSVQFSSAAQSCPTLCNPMNRSTPGLPVHHQLPEFTQTHVHWVGDAIQPSHPLSSPSPPALNLSQHQGLFKWVSSSHQVAKVLEFQLQHQSFQWAPRSDRL